MTRKIKKVLLQAERTSFLNRPHGPGGVRGLGATAAVRPGRGPLLAARRLGARLRRDQSTSAVERGVLAAAPGSASLLGCFQF